METINEYEQKVQDFLEKTQTKLSVQFEKYDFYFPDDKEKRDIYSVTLARKDRHFTFKFGQCLNDSGFKIINPNIKKELGYLWLKEANETAQGDEKKFKKIANERLQSLKGLLVVNPIPPTAYDILAILQKYEIGTFEEFCQDFGYSNDSIKAFEVYRASVDEYKNVFMLYNHDEMEMLRQIE